MRGREIEIDREKKRGRDRVIDSMGERDERQREREREREREKERRKQFKGNSDQNNESIRE